MAAQWASQGFPPDDLKVPTALPFYWRTLTDPHLPDISPNQLRSDIYLYKSPSSVGQEPLPIIIDIHGGSWQRGSASDDHSFASYMAERGYAVFTIDYRKAPISQYPAQIQDVRNAMQWVFRNAPYYGADPSRISLVGRSAGGQLALLAAYTVKRIPVRAVVSLYGPTDLTEAYEDPPEVDPLDIRAKLKAYMGNDPGELPDAYREASPISHIEGDLPPTLLIQGAHDDIVRPALARKLQSALEKNGTKALLLELPWSEHAFDFVDFGPGNRFALIYIEAFLTDVMTPWKTQPLTE
jgi:acetyl esterase/lipase